MTCVDCGQKNLHCCEDQKCTVGDNLLCRLGPSNSSDLNKCIETNGTKDEYCNPNDTNNTCDIKKFPGLACTTDFKCDCSGDDSLWKGCDIDHVCAPSGKEPPSPASPSPTPPAPKKGCDYTIKKNSDAASTYVYKDIPRHPFNDISECEDLCSAKKNCGGFAKAGDNACYFKPTGEAVSSKGIVSKNGVDLYIKTCTGV